MADALKPPTDAKRRAMQLQRRADTTPEVALRRALHRRGLRFRLHAPIVPDTRRRVDVVFRPSKVAVDVRGCFWHGCPSHATKPRSNAAWWSAKLEANVARDADTAERLKAVGWELVVVWEHDEPEAAADRIAELVRSRRQSVQGSRVSLEGR